ncbi:pyridoxal kinase PdxY [Rhodospirillaceae bacterium SYSU D60014]|uniref:pyridoxal kinase PdxY n=1 Tax=Virgifigura deserti TaxID=2268457 RepID=UPI000E667D1D
MNILSIQSRVAYGHVGNAAAVFPLQRLGFDVWPIDTVGFSNHLGYDTWSGRVHEPAELAEILDGLARLGVLERCDAVLSGYLGAAGTGAVVLDAVARVRAANPRALYCCDPVMGDREGGLFVGPDIPPVFDGLTAAADIALPNAFELEQLTGGSTATLAAALEAVDRLRRSGPDLVIVTSLRRQDGPAGRIEVLGVDQDGAWLATTPSLNCPTFGAGDTFAALFLGHYLRDRSLETALARAVSAIYAVVEASSEAGTEELRIIAAQDALVAAEPRFTPVKVR